MNDDSTTNPSSSTHAGVNAAKMIGDSMSSMGTNAMNEFTRMFAEMKVPPMLDMEALLAAHRRNLETLSAANRLALEGAQAVARRNMEIMQQTMAELTEGMRSFTAGEPPQSRAIRQADMLKSAYERAVANMQEISDLIQRSNGEALELLNKRFTEAVDEVKTMVAKGQVASE
ncbi:phasin family protein [Acidisphaera sp. L21]|uniref:phasin family protein n=1 Tax=Acidisphaera sp. L21 TaxID=1641851 RepID=UPI0020B162B4|nr:TIGR01841 family phasin [Acidisphaera sp. L21]